jgi:RNA polymerase sigma factor (sigma-70 family)
MATEQLRAYLRRLRGVLAAGAAEGVSDVQLLERFVTDRDEAAFEVLVWRHGGLVLDVCGRLLRQAADREDVFQATFLVLVRKAGSIGKRASLGSWLYKVAYRLALRVRAQSARHRTQPLAGVDPAVPPAAGGEVAPELRPVLDEEIQRLPEKYRAPLVLCYLHGRTTEEAARQLGCPRGTVCSRLSWARRRLRSRLTRRGLGLSAVGLTEALSPSTAPAALVAATVRAMAAITSGQVPGTALSGPVLRLAEGVWRSMLLTKLKMVAGVVLLVGCLGLGAGLWLPQAFADKPGAGGGPTLVRGTGDGVRLPPEMLAKVGIQVAEVKARPAVPRVLRLPGSLALDPARLQRVRCRFGPVLVVKIGTAEGKGKQELHVGDKVRKGQLLAVVVSDDPARKKNELLDALVQLGLDEAILERAEKAKDSVSELFLLNTRRSVEADRNAVNRALNTLRSWGIPQADIDAVTKEAEEVGKRKGKRDPAADKAWGRVELRAAEDGILVERNVSRGEAVGDDSGPLFQIARLDWLKVLVQVPEEDLPLLQGLTPEQRRWTIRGADGDTETGGRIDDILVRVGETRTGSLLFGDGVNSDAGLTGSIVLNERNFDLAYPLASPDDSRYGRTFRGAGEEGRLEQHTAVATGWLDNPEGRWRPGQFITASITLPAAAEVALPAGAVVEEGSRSFVFVQPDAAKPFYEQRRVAVVRRGRDAVHIRSRLTAEQQRQGLQTVRPGERIVTAGVVELQAVLEDLKAGQER